MKLRKFWLLHEVFPLLGERVRVRELSYFEDTKLPHPVPLPKERRLTPIVSFSAIAL